MSTTGAGRSRLGDEHDFEDFYAAVFDQLVGQLFLVTGNLQDAEDAVQEALTRAALRWPRLRRYRVPEADDERLRDQEEAGNHG
jgi:RNA polymerase sigma-70 factor (ECF subfamily)